MNENNIQKEQQINNHTKEEQNTHELNKMKQVISIEAGQNSEIVKENKETKNKN